MGKKRKIVTILSLMSILLFGLTACDKSKDNVDNKKESKEIIETGYYYNVDKTAEVAVLENGNACYFPDFNNNDNYYYGEYTFKDNILTISKGSAYWKFELKNKDLTFIEYKYAGTITDTREEMITFTHSNEPINVLKRGRYETENYMHINVGANEMTLLFDPGANPHITGKYTVEDDVITFGDEDDYAVVELKDGNLHLKYYWYYGTYKEFAEGEIVFKPEYVLKDQLVGKEAYVPKDEISVGEKDEQLDEVLPGYGTYYNENMTSELIMYENGYARYCPMIDSTVNFYGKCTVENGMLVIRETDSKYIGIDGFYQECVMVTSMVKLAIDGDKIMVKEYTDSQGETHAYDDEIYTFSYNPDKKIDSLRPGKYYNGDDKYVSIDGKGKISLFLNLDKEADLEKKYFYDYMMGTYEVEGDTIYVTGEDGNSAELLFDAGKLTVTKYKFYEATEADDNGELTFFYNYDDLVELQLN